ncbi:MAG: hypothetical protein BBJ57_02360 [Desulfobacterales bacterium PC51MH44]|nr:MAG: hypothetical protein BBJ57_02360 [Desulfobacterales bacterium PC51MH44]
MLKVELLNFEDLSDIEKEGASNNGFGKEYVSYIKVTHDDDVLYLESDGMEPEDATFYRDLSWIPGMLKACYALGEADSKKTI